MTHGWSVRFSFVFFWEMELYKYRNVHHIKLDLYVADEIVFIRNFNFQRQDHKPGCVYLFWWWFLSILEQFCLLWRLHFRIYKIVCVCKTVFLLCFYLDDWKLFWSLLVVIIILNYTRPLLDIWLLLASLHRRLLYFLHAEMITKS